MQRDSQLRNADAFPMKTIQPQLFDPENPPPILFKFGFNEELSARLQTAGVLADAGFDDEDEIGREAALQTFSYLHGQDRFDGIGADPKKANRMLADLRTPDAIRTLVASLTAYEWDFVEYAAELRSMCVATLAEDAQNLDPKVRLRAIELLGRVAEVGLFEDKVSIKKQTVVDDADLNEKLNEKLAKLGYIGTPRAKDAVIDAEIIALNAKKGEE